MYTFDLPVKTNVEVAAFADDASLFASDNDPIAASEKLQTDSNELEK